MRPCFSEIICTERSVLPIAVLSWREWWEDLCANAALSCYSDIVCLDFFFFFLIFLNFPRSYLLGSLQPQVLLAHSPTCVNTLPLLRVAPYLCYSPNKSRQTKWFGPLPLVCCANSTRRQKNHLSSGSLHCKEYRLWRRTPVWDSAASNKAAFWNPAESGSEKVLIPSRWRWFHLWMEMWFWLNTGWCSL